MLFLYRFFCGILKVEFSGIFPEKILNLCAKNGINVWSARYKNNKIFCFITVRDFLKLPKILRKNSVRVHILEKKGFPFFVKKYKNRFGILTGFIIFFAFLYIMSGFIWVVEVEGNKTVSDSAVISLCEDLGLKAGVRTERIDTKNDAQSLLLKTDKLAWAGINIEGCRLTVNVSEVTQKKEDNSVATNLKATADGIISHIDVTSGNCVVKVGDTVKKGDILVSGIIENASGTKFVHSIGSIIAETEETVSLSGKFIKQIKLPTGKKAKRSVLEFFTIKIPLYIGRQRGDFETKTNIKETTLFSNKLPITLYTKEFMFYENQTRQLSYDELCAELDKKLSAMHTGSVKSKEFTQTADGVILHAVINEKKDITVSENLILAIGN